MHDGLGTALQIETATEHKTLPVGQDPMAPRWCINTAVRDKYVDGERVGFAYLPFGQWKAVTRFNTPKEIHTTDDNPNLPRERVVTETALSAQLVLDEMLGGKDVAGTRDPQKQDWGIRFGFHGEEDHAKMAVISATLLPSLSTIKQIAERLVMPSPIPDICPGEDSVDFGERETCPKCWLAWIESSVYDAYVAEVAITGRQVQVTDIVTGDQQMRVVTPSLDEFATAKTLTVESLKAGIIAGEKTWRTIAVEMEKGERRDADAYQNNIRKDVHANKPADAQLANIREYARVVGEGGGGNNDALLARLAESQIQTNALLAQLVTPGGTPAPAPAVAQEPADVVAVVEQNLEAAFESEEPTYDLSTPAGRMQKARDAKKNKEDK